MKAFEHQASPFAKAGLIVGISLVLGFLFDLLIYGKFPGLAFPVYVALIVAGLFGVSWLYGRKVSGDVLWLLVPVFFFAMMVAVRASFLLTGLNLVAVLLLLLLAAQVAFSEQLGSYRIRDYFAVALLPFMFIVGLIKSLGDLFTLRGVKKNKRTITQVITGVAITIPLLVVFSLLFASADLVFERALSQVFHFKLGPEFIFRTILIFLATLGFAGAYSFVFRKSELGVSFPVAVPGVRKAGGFGRIESSILLGSINALFGAFILVQITYLFGGLVNVSGQGFTYAQYARRGFGELVAVAVITLGILLLVERFIAKDEAGHSGLFRVLSTMLVVQVMVIMASSLTRMSLYEMAYGFTELRLYVHVFIFFIAAVYVALLYKIHIDDRENTFTFKVFLLTIAFLVLMNAVNPDAYVARHNMQRFRQTGKIDAGYLGGLSDDALPVTISLLESKDEETRDKYASRLYARVKIERTPLFSRWQSLNLSRQRAKDLLPKATASGAKAVAVTYFKLRENAKYADAYKLLSADTRKLVSLKNYISDNTYKDTSTDYYHAQSSVDIPLDFARSLPKPLIKVVDARLEGDKAIITADEFMVGKGRWTFAFIDGRWYRDFEATRLLDYGVKPESIPAIKQASLNEAFSTPGFKAVVTKVEKDKNFTNPGFTGQTLPYLPADGIYVMTYLTITNTGKKTINFPLFPAGFPRRTYFLLFDSRQRQCMPEQPSVFGFTGLGGFPILIDPGKSAIYPVGFDVPEDAKGFRLIIGTGTDAANDVVYRVDLGL